MIAEQDKVIKSQTHGLSYFLDNFFGSDDGFQIMFVYQPKFKMSELKKDKNINYAIGWKSKVLFNSKLLPLHGAYLPNITHFWYKIGIQFYDTPLVVEQN